MTEPPVVFSFYNTLIYTWIAIAVIVFFILLRITAPYGRHTVKGWGPNISNRLGWIIMESPVLIVLYAFILPQADRLPLAVWIMIGLFTFHYVHRAFIFPFRLHTKGKTMPLVIAGSGILFNLVNGFLLGYFFAYLQRYPVLWFADIRFIIGFLVFLVGVYINWKADNKLIHLRKPGETGYIIPRGWLFEKISCPNLFGELVEWLGFAILCWNLPALTFFIWTAANLIPRAISHHRWYQGKFPDYPKMRKAILPFFV
jgi:3-oxo-5-alpha-steroid 4-dehydrogenase 1